INRDRSPPSIQDLPGRRQLVQASYLFAPFLSLTLAPSGRCWGGVPATPQAPEEAGWPRCAAAKFRRTLTCPPEVLKHPPSLGGLKTLKDQVASVLSAKSALQKGRSQAKSA